MTPEPIHYFLTRNGLKEMEPNSYANELCNVVIREDHITVANNYGWTIYSDDLNIYWLIGVLLYCDFIDKHSIVLR